MLEVDNIEILHDGTHEILHLHFTQKGWHIFRERGSIYISSQTVTIQSNRRKFTGDANNMRELIVEQTTDEHILRFICIMAEQDKQVLLVRMPSFSDAEKINEFIKQNPFD